MQRSIFLRLLKDGKIVGYIELTSLGIGLTYKNSAFIICDDVDYDAFELRSPFKDKNDQWLWEGDKIRASRPNVDLIHETFIMYGIWNSSVSGGYGFYVVGTDNMLTSLYPDQKYIEKIGTIHE